MRKLSLTLTTLLGLACVSIPVSANLIINGSFENTAVAQNSWAWFNSDYVDGWQGSNIEIWNSYNNVTAYQGTQHAELNAHPSNGQAFSIFQTFATQIGNIYDLSFAYQARSNSNESFLVSLISSSNTDLFTDLMDDHVVGQWSVFSTKFTAIDLTTTLRFTSVSPYSDTVGNFIDDIQVNALPKAYLSADNQVSEPGGFLLAGLACLALFRLNKSRLPLKDKRV